MKNVGSTLISKLHGSANIDVNERVGREVREVVWRTGRVVLMARGATMKDVYEEARYNSDESYVAVACAVGLSARAEVWEGVSHHWFDELVHEQLVERARKERR